MPKVKRKAKESDQDYFRRLFDKTNALEDADWKKLSEPAQHWANAASEAVEKKETIPNFDGEVVEPEAEQAAEPETEAEEPAAEEEAEAEAEAPPGKKGSKKSAKAKPEVAPKKDAGKAKPTAKAPAADKAASAKEKAKPKAEGDAKRGRKGAFSDADKVTKVAPKDPFREGSKASKCFKEYKVGRTVKEILSKGVPRSKLKRHSDKGFVTIGAAKK